MEAARWLLACSRSPGGHRVVKGPIHLFGRATPADESGPPRGHSRPATGAGDQSESHKNCRQLAALLVGERLQRCANSVV